VGLRFKLDENLPAAVERTLRLAGHDAHTALVEGLAGASDDRLLAACTSEGRLLITLDLDFADLRRYPSGSHCGIWVLRPAQQTVNTITALVAAGLRLAEGEAPASSLWVIDERRVRIRA
jgi:predicted nuclease of predicted toxin-antitoxin system